MTRAFLASAEGSVELCKPDTSALFARAWAIPSPVGRTGWRRVVAGLRGRAGALGPLRDPGRDLGRRNGSLQEVALDLFAAGLAQPRQRIRGLDALGDDPQP